MKLARNLTLALVVGIFLVLGMSAYVRVQREAGLFAADIRRDDHTMGRALSAAVLEVWRTQGEARALSIVDEANERESQVDIRWVWLDAPPGDKHAPRLPADALAPARLGRETSGKMAKDGTDFLVTVVPVPVPSPRPGAVELSESLAGQRDYVRSIVVSTALSTLALTLVSAVITTVLGLLVVGRPMRALIEQARRVGAGDLSRRLSLGQRDEIGELGREMNRMCDQLAAAQEKLAAEAQARTAVLDQLRHAERLATVGQLASGVAHELGAPLQIVMGRAEMIGEGDATPADLSTHARLILEQGRRMTKIIRQLLDFARPRSTQKDRVDLRQIAELSCALLRPLAAKQRIEIVREDEAPSAAAEADAEQLQQALMNVVMNGMQAMPSGGVLKVGVRSTVARPPADVGGAEGHYLALSVEDEGAGIPAESLAHVFEPFFTTKPVGEGTGLGLAVAYGIVHEHQGWIDVESQVGKGSRFTFFFPEAERA